MKYIFLSLFVLLSSANVVAQTPYQKDFEEFCTDIGSDYAYLEEQKIDWEKVKETYRPMVDTVKSGRGFIQVLEMIINDLHNGHNSLRTNLSSSNRIIPSGADLFMERREERYFVSDVREGFPADLAGLKPGMEVVSLNGKPIDEAIKPLLPKFTEEYTDAMVSYALNMLLAGKHNEARKISVLDNGKEKVFSPDDFKGSRPDYNGELLSWELRNNNVGYIKMNNSLGEYDLVAEFDKVLDQLLETDQLIIDLSDTPGGGNTTVARGILGRFISEKKPYQRHEYTELPINIKRHWVEYVLPRGKTYQGKITVVVGHWTGSMGEGMAIGFDAISDATIVGTKMAGLLGAVGGYVLSNTRIEFQFAMERLYHVNGTPREDFVPEKEFSSGCETTKWLKKLSE